MRLTPGYPTKVDWHVAGPFQTYVALPVPAALLRELYVDIGLSIHHVALLLGLGDFATRNRLIQAGVSFRPSPGRCLQRTDPNWADELIDNLARDVKQRRRRTSRPVPRHLRRPNSSNRDWPPHCTPR